LVYLNIIYKNDELLKEHIKIEDDKKLQPIQVLIKNISFLYVDDMVKILELCILFNVDLNIQLVKNNEHVITIADYLASHKTLFKKLSPYVKWAILKCMDNEKYVDLLKYITEPDEVFVEVFEKKKMESACYICYCDDIDDYYYTCENKHNYHNKCMMSYYNKVDVDIKCFYCKGRYDFSRVYKSCE
jgi:hypothetical protein